MPDFELIDASAVPVSSHQGTAVLYREECERHLRLAMQGGKALVVRLAVGERVERYREYLRRASRGLGVHLIVTTSTPRTRTLSNGRQVVENSVMYVRIRRESSSPEPAQPPPSLTAATTVAHPGRLASAPSQSRSPLDGFRYEEPKRRGPKPKFTIPTPQPDYQSLGRGGEVDR